MTLLSTRRKPGSKIPNITTLDSSSPDVRQSASGSSQGRIHPLAEGIHRSGFSQE